MESVDWRTQHPSDLRQKVVNKILETLKKHIPVTGHERLNEIKDIALRFEDKTYTIATSQNDYMRRISVKLLSMENKSANPIPNSLQSNSSRNTVNPSDSGSQAIQQVNNQVQPPSIPLPCNHPQAGTNIMPPVSGISQSTTTNVTGQSPNMQNIQNISVGNNMGHGIPSGNQRQIPGTQRYFYQQQHPNVLHPSQFQPSQQSVPQHTVLQPSQFQSSQQSVPLHTVLQPSQFQSSQQSVPLHTVLQPSQFQSSQQSVPLHTVLQPSQFQPSQQSIPQPTIVQASSLPTLKQNQQTGVPQSCQPVSRQSVLTQQRQQPNATNLQHIQHTGQPRNVQQPHQHSNFSSIHQQYSGHMLQSTQGQRSQMPQLQTQSAQLQNQLNIKQRLPTSAAFQSQNVIDPQKQIFQQQRAMPEASSTSSDSTAQTGNPNGGDWQEEVYQKMKAMKDKYMPFLNKMYQKLIDNFQKLDSHSQQQKNDQVVKMKQTLEYFMSFLQVPKSKISPKLKENLGLYEMQIVNVLTLDKRKPGTTLNNAPLRSQQTQANENQLNSQHNNNIVNLNHNSVSNTNQNILGMLQPNSNVVPQQQVKQLQNVQVRQQLPHKQNLPHERQFHQQTKHQQQNRQQIKVKSESESESSQQQIKAPFSPQVDHQNMLNFATKSGRPLQFGNTPSIVSSPTTPSTSHMPGGDAEKVNSGVSSLSNGAMLPTQPLAVGTPSTSTSPLLVSENHDNGASLVSGNSSSIEDPMEYLLKVVKSISQKSLSSSASNIGSVVSMIDSIAGPAPGNGSRAVIGEDLVAMTKSCLQERMFVTHDGTRRMKRLRSQMPLNVTSSPSSVIDSFMLLNWAEASELESTATSTVKRQRIETRNPLLDEIREINQGLVDTVVNISEEDIGKGTVVKCSFSPVALDPNLKSQYASEQMSSIQPLRLLVPTNYPTCSPVLLDTFPLEVSKDYGDLSNKAKLRFSSCVRQLSNPMSLEEMARTWDVCARAVIMEYSQQTGGGTYTSKNGAWKDCLTAS